LWELRGPGRPGSRSGGDVPGMGRGKQADPARLLKLACSSR
jgi:hypothetical protein